MLTDLALSDAFLVLSIFYPFNKMTEVTTANFLLLLLPRFCVYFSIQTLQFLLVGAQIFSRAQGTLDTPLTLKLYHNIKNSPFY